MQTIAKETLYDLWIATRSPRYEEFATSPNTEICRGGGLRRMRVRSWQRREQARAEWTGGKDQVSRLYSLEKNKNADIECT